MSLENMYGVPEGLSHSDTVRNAWFPQNVLGFFQNGTLVLPRSKLVCL